MKEFKEDINNHLNEIRESIQDTKEKFNRDKNTEKKKRTNRNFINKKSY